jgi:hypothetical protein
MNPSLRHDLDSVIRLRAHTILCLQGFRGMGYSPEFVANMAAVHRTLTEDPESVVELLDSPDAICGACPHRRVAGCTLNGNGSEQEMTNQDHVVLHRLQLRVGDRVTWQEILDRVRAFVHADDLPAICGNCRWLSLGFCQEGIGRLRHPVLDRFSEAR